VRKKLTLFPKGHYIDGIVIYSAFLKIYFVNEIEVGMCEKFAKM